RKAQALRTEETAVPGKSSAKPDTIAGIKLTHPDKVLYPEQNVTKHDIAEYYEAVADDMLPHIIERPISLVRCPEGEGKPCFFQRHGGLGTSKHIKPINIDVKGDRRPYIMIEDIRGLIALVQMDVLEIHIWGA